MFLQSAKNQIPPRSHGFSGLNLFAPVAVATVHADILLGVIAAPPEVSVPQIVEQ